MGSCNDRRIPVWDQEGFFEEMNLDLRGRGTRGPEGGGGGEEGREESLSFFFRSSGHKLETIIPGFLAVSARD